MGGVFRNSLWCQSVAIICLLSSLMGGQQGRSGSGRSGLQKPPTQQLPSLEIEPTRGLSEKQKREILRSNFDKMKHDADQLAELAGSLQDDLKKSNENVLSLQIVEKAERIEKLARKIKTAARGD